MKKSNRVTLSILTPTVLAFVIFTMSITTGCDNDSQDACEEATAFKRAARDEICEDYPGCLGCDPVWDDVEDSLMESFDIGCEDDNLEEAKSCLADKPACREETMAAYAHDCESDDEN